jgi:hypothetical protein
MRPGQGLLDTSVVIRFNRLDEHSGLAGICGSGHRSAPVARSASVDVPTVVYVDYVDDAAPPLKMKRSCPLLNTEPIEWRNTVVRGTASA